MKSFISTYKFPIILCIVLSIVLIGLIILGNKPKTQVSSPSQTPSVSWRGISPGISSIEDVSKVLGIPIKQNNNEFEFQSTSQTRNNIITTENGKVVLVRQIITKNDTETIQQLSQQYGPSPTRLYGPDSVGGIDLYVYPTKGIAYLANKEQNVLYEIWYFEPRENLQEFINKWAKDYSLEYTDEHGAF